MAALFYLLDTSTQKLFTANDKILKEVRATPSNGAAVYKKYARYGKPPLTYFVGRNPERLTISGKYYTEMTEGKTIFADLYDWRDNGSVVSLLWLDSPIPFVPQSRASRPHSEKYNVLNVLETPGELFEHVPIEAEFRLTLERVYD